MKKDKPYKGRISNVQKIRAVDDGPYLSEVYGPNLGWAFSCYFMDHPQFAGSYGHTSLAVKYDEDTGELETLNTRYTVVKDVR